MNKKETILLGAIKLGDKVYISDPCYKPNAQGNGIIDNVLPGTYFCYVTISDEGTWGNRIARIDVIHKKYKGKASRVTNLNIGVDSGQCGIYDKDYFVKMTTKKNNDDWYDNVCNGTYDKVKKAFTASCIDGRAIVSSSGFGDGSYDALIKTNSKNQVTAIAVAYL